MRTWRDAIGATSMLGLLILAPGALARDGGWTWETGGHAKYQLTHTDFRSRDIAAALGDDPALDQSLDLRLKAEGRRGAWDAAVHYEVLALAGDSVALPLRTALLGLPAAAIGGLPDDGRRLFDLTDTLSGRSRLHAVHRLDRLALGHSTPGRVLRFGRQAVSWGNGLLFHPFDFVNPFPPIAIDKDYKTGDDMAYGQWVLARGDVQAIVVPRRGKRRAACGPTRARPRESSGGAPGRTISICCSRGTTTRTSRASGSYAASGARCGASTRP